MTTIYSLKPRFQALLRPLVNILAARGITANQVTIAALGVSVLLGLAIAINPENLTLLLALPIWLFARMGLNAIDGMLAREHNMQSKLGAVLNELGDVIADAALYLPFALLAGVSPILVVIVVLLAVISEMTGVVAIQIGADRRYDGPMGKSDRAFLFGVAGLLIGLGLAPGLWLNIAFIIATILLIITIVNRSRCGIREAN